jgi:thiol-disulfide isomerase/thioredoxin
MTVLLLWLLALQGTAQQPGRTIVGTIDRLVPGGGQARVELRLSTDRDVPGVAEGDRVYRAVAREFTAGGATSGLLVAFVERSTGIVLFLDRNLDGRLSIDEGLASTPEATFIDGPELTFPIGENRPGAPKFPFRWRLFTQNGRFFFEFSATFHLEGHATIGGQRTLVSIPFNAGPDRGSLRFGRIGMDANGDGKIDFSTFTGTEAVWADGKPALFRVAGHVVSVESVDRAAKTFLLREHPPEAYKYVHLQVGDPMPEFSFTDFEGRARKLSDFLGRYVLLDFWGTWCGPCLAEFPTLRTARERFADRNFEILGIDYEKGGTLAHARAVVKERGVTWPNAAPDTVKELVEDVLRITAFPSKILVGPDGRVVAFLNFDVVGGELLRRLDALIR